VSSYNNKDKEKSGDKTAITSVNAYYRCGSKDYFIADCPKPAEN